MEGTAPEAVAACQAGEIRRADRSVAGKVEGTAVADLVRATPAALHLQSPKKIQFPILYRRYRRHELIRLMRIDAGPSREVVVPEIQPAEGTAICQYFQH